MRCKSILIVEDDRDIRETLQQILELEGFSTITATNGKEALELLKTIEHPCLILLDLMMPVMNGWEFLEARRADDLLATIPVVVVSATVEKNRPVHANEYIKKPVELEALLSMVHKYCDDPKPFGSKLV